MNKVLRFTLIAIAILALAGGIFFAGNVYARATGFGFPWMMGSRGGYNMMGNRNGYGMMGSRNGYNMMSGNANNASNTTPLTADQAKTATGKYLASLNNSDLKIAEVMVFDNNAYVRVVEKSTGIGAFELLVDPVSQVVYPEPGPNMMWNLKYGGMIGQQMMGGGKGNFPGMGMMGNYAGNATPADVSSKMPITSAQALQIAQKYLDTALPGAKTATDADAFYGYYTIDFLRDGKTVGMLSVNGFSGQVFLHIWHGTFLEVKDY